MIEALRNALFSRAALVAALVVGLVPLAVMRIHVRVQTTLIGYEIGRLKGEEAQLMEQRSSLKMQLAKLTTRKHLSLMSDTARPAAAATASLAANP